MNLKEKKEKQIKIITERKWIQKRMGKKGKRRKLAETPKIKCKVSQSTKASFGNQGSPGNPVKIQGSWPTQQTSPWNSSGSFGRSSLGTLWPDPRCFPGRASHDSSARGENPRLCSSHLIDLEPTDPGVLPPILQTPNDVIKIKEISPVVERDLICPRKSSDWGLLSWFWLPC